MFGHVEMHPQDSRVGGIAVSGEVRVRLHEEVTHVSVAGSPLRAGETFREKLDVHKRRPTEQIVFDVVGHFPPLLQFEGLDGSVQNVHVSFDALFY